MAVSTLVTGGSGLIGRPLIERLAGAEGGLHALARNPPADHDGAVRWHRVDLADEAAVAALMGELAPDRLVHLAWYVEHGRFWSAPENLDWVARSLRLLRAFAAAGGSRAVIAGTCAEYDWSVADRPLDERSSPLAPTTLYGTAKDSLRRLSESFAEQAGIELAWARPFFFYGPGENEARLVPAIVTKLLAGEPVDTTAGTQRRDFLHVEDVAGAIASLLESAVQGPVNIASGEATPVLDVAHRLAGLIGRSELLRVGTLPQRDEPPLLVADVARLREEVGFEPRWKLDEGLHATVQWWEAQLARR